MEMKKRMLQMMELLLARQEKVHADAKARQEKADAEAKARHERYLAILDGWKSYGKGTMTCQIETMSCPEEMKGAIKT
jgi:polyphosphate kinase 2 (PPK2 family)